MEKTSFPPINGNPVQPLQAAAPFSIHDAATGNNRAIRDMTDQELARYIQQYAQETLKQLGLARAAFENQFAAAQVALNASRSAQATVSVLGFEQHRRRVALEIASKMPA